METIRTLGLYQPFAGLMLHGKIETRFVRNGRKPPFPLGKYLIYSTLKSYDVYGGGIVYAGGLDNICTPEQIHQILDLMNSDAPAFNTFGSALMLADLAYIIDPITPDIENTFVQYVAPDSTHRRVGLVFENVQRIKPFAFKGKQGIGFLTDEQRAQIEIILTDKTTLAQLVRLAIVTKSNVHVSVNFPDKDAHRDHHYRLKLPVVENNKVQGA
jgi:hypothetical protein